MCLSSKYTKYNTCNIEGTKQKAFNTNFNLRKNWTWKQIVYCLSNPNNVALVVFQSTQLNVIAYLFINPDEKYCHKSFRSKTTRHRTHRIERWQDLFRVHTIKIIDFKHRVLVFDSLYIFPFEPCEIFFIKRFETQRLVYRPRTEQTRTCFAPTPNTTTHTQWPYVHTN